MYLCGARRIRIPWCAATLPPSSSLGPLWRTRQPLSQGVPQTPLAEQSRRSYSYCAPTHFPRKNKQPPIAPFFLVDCIYLFLYAAFCQLKENIERHHWHPRRYLIGSSHLPSKRTSEKGAALFLAHSRCGSTPQEHGATVPIKKTVRINGRPREGRARDARRSPQ